jgi:hypothetical protein
MSPEDEKDSITNMHLSTSTSMFHLDKYEQCNITGVIGFGDVEK